MIETRYNAKVWVLRSDNGGEYQSFDLQKYLEGHGIIQSDYLFQYTPGECHKEIQNSRFMIIISLRKMNLDNLNYYPNSVQESLADPRWKAAMNEEMKSLQKNETWELVECPPGKEASWVSLDLYCEVQGRWMHGVRKAMSEGVQIEEVIVWVEAIPENMVWKLQEMILKKEKPLQNYLSREFEMKDLGPLKYFLGIEVFSIK
ncbi:hypothetical protein CK203_065108 [Vitis vinifera]|uniref:Retrovirus-related Pol polyprotein from transposon TNT 1-94 n=1 Tax=Vitis vinifera TaxID=29760 RepID=A0A438FPU9_VITVI|nr:hypothetical protein CK203_065108 [Vitis vinifera]